MVKTTLLLPWALCGPNFLIGQNGIGLIGQNHSPGFRKIPLGFFLPIGLRTAVQLPPRVNPEFTPVVIGWAGTGETCCTGAEVRGSRAEMRWPLSWRVLHTAELVCLVSPGCHQRQVDICQAGRTPSQRGKSKPAPFFLQWISSPQSPTAGSTAASRCDPATL